MIGAIVAGGLSAPTAPVTNSYESIATGVGTGASGTITFATIPSGYKHLQVRWIATASIGGAIYVNINGDGGTNYSAHNINGSGSGTPGAQAQSAASNPLIIRNGGITTTGDTMTVGVFDLLDYAETTKNKTWRNLGGYDANGSGLIELASGAWYNTAAVTSLSFIHNGGNFTTDSVFALYGIKG